MALVLHFVDVPTGLNCLSVRTGVGVDEVLGMINRLVGIIHPDHIRPTCGPHVGEND